MVCMICHGAISSINTLEGCGRNSFRHFFANVDKITSRLWLSYLFQKYRLYRHYIQYCNIVTVHSCSLTGLDRTFSRLLRSSDTSSGDSLSHEWACLVSMLEQLVPSKETTRWIVHTMIHKNVKQIFIFIIDIHRLHTSGFFSYGVNDLIKLYFTYILLRKHQIPCYKIIIYI